MKTKSHIQSNFQNSFRERVQKIVKSIPKGSVLSYGEVALRAGAAGAARAVGTIMSKNTNKTIPCHRVVKSDGSIGGYNGLRTSTTGTLAKIKLLKKEGVKFSKSSKVVFN
jgi:O-6-methylguanine DNA methyltransferase